MDFDDYQRGTGQTNIYSAAIEDLLEPIKRVVENSGDFPAESALTEVEGILNAAYVLLGGLGEFGEVANKFKKVIRGDRDMYEFGNLAFDETGDVLWYLSELSTQLDHRLNDVAANNNGKLLGRQLRGTLQGDGDQR